MCKRFSIMAVLVLAAACSADDIVTADGNSYKNVQVRQTTPLGITGTVTENGQEQAVWIPYDNMAASDRQKYGYDKAKADAFISTLNANRTQLDDGTVVSSPNGQIKEKSVQMPGNDASNPNNPIQGNQLNYNAASGVTPVVAGGINPQAGAVATPGTYSYVGTQQVAASVPGTGVSVAPSGIGVNTPVGNVGISPSGIGINTPVANVGVTPNCIGVQTPVGNVAVTPGPVPVPMYPVAPAVVPVIYAPIQAANIPQPAYYTPNVVVPAAPVAYNAYGDAVVQYANPVVYNDGMPQTWIIYNGCYTPYSAYYGYWQNNWCYYNGCYIPAPYYFGWGYWNGYGWRGWRNPCGYYRGRYYGYNFCRGNNYRGNYGYRGGYSQYNGHGASGVNGGGPRGSGHGTGR